jgi:hypothetical protein
MKFNPVRDKKLGLDKPRASDHRKKDLVASEFRNSSEDTTIKLAIQEVHHTLFTLNDGTESSILLEMYELDTLIIYLQCFRNAMQLGIPIHGLYMYKDIIITLHQDLPHLYRVVYSHDEVSWKGISVGMILKLEEGIDLEYFPPMHDDCDQGHVTPCSCIDKER